MKNRLLIELDNLRRGVNRSIINPLVPELSMESLTPLLTMVAQARAEYVQAVLQLADQQQGQAPNMEQIGELKNKRVVFEELVSAVNALETVIQREYMDVKTTRSPAKSRAEDPL
ncbi:hypothetical protein V6U78_10665 [Marinospirillum sp. MEB164]|uniref:Uncharacterized protein n=1 Tax=Marinospirillum alkalitolerans TaxID=3123374 RepID=A0ABW8Q040_9GAMM